MRDLRERIAEDGITAEATMTDAPAWADRDWQANWYRVTLTYDGRTLVTPFGMGTGLTEEPDAATVLNSLTSDATGIENARGSFDEWAGEYGYDTGSRKAEASWRQAQEQTDTLRAFLGERYDDYLWNTEGL